VRELEVDPDPVDHVGFTKRVRPFVWGFASQAASSATNFGLSLVAALVLGPTGLGTVFVGFSFYLLSLGFQRALIVDPLVAASSTLEGEERSEATRAAFTMCLVWGGFSTLLVAVAGIVAPGDLGNGLILFVPWLVPSLVQDFWRVILFREGRERAAVANDLLWAAGMALSLSLLALSRNEWIVVSTWGLGAVGGMTIGYFQAGVRPTTPMRSFTWWRGKAWPLGRWLTAEGIVYSIGSQGLVFVLVLVLGTQSLGGLRAVQTLFAPLTLLAPAIALPGLPELSRQTARSRERARRLALFLGMAAAALTGGYVLLASLGGRRFLGLVFGEGFSGFASLLLPVGVGQLLIASSVGFALLLKAQRRGKALLWTRVVGSAVAFGLASVLAVSYGVKGAAWGMAAGSAANALLVSVLAFGGADEGRTTGSGSLP
jgi:O-antigen/teichoic acid export membrane protein